MAARTKASRAGKRAAKAKRAAAKAKRAAAKAKAVAKPWTPKVGDMVIGVENIVEGWKGEVVAVNHTWIVTRWITDDQGNSRNGHQPGYIPRGKQSWLALDVKA